MYELSSANLKTEAISTEERIIEDKILSYEL